MKVSILLSHGIQRKFVTKELQPSERVSCKILASMLTGEKRFCSLPGEENLRSAILALIAKPQLGFFTPLELLRFSFKIKKMSL